MQSIATPVGLYLWNPVTWVCSHLEFALEAPPVAAVPEIAIAEYCDMRVGKHEIWFAGKGADILAVAQTEGPYGSPQE